MVGRRVVGHPVNARSWLEAGRRTANVDLQDETVEFATVQEVSRCIRAS
jgi:hypothetical protein